MSRILFIRLITCWVMLTTKRGGFLNHVGHGVKTFKQIYDVVSPLVSKYANTHSDKINNNVNRVIGGYENIRNKVIEGDQDIQKVKHRFKNT